MDVISYSKAKKAQEKANSVEAQLNQAVQSGNQLAETQQARVDDEGVAHSTLQARLNSDANKRKALTGRVADVEEELSLQDRRTQTLKHGLNVIESDQASPLEVEMHGNTLVSLGNSVLQEGKRYVLADRKYKVKFADGLTYTGVGKFIGQNERPSVIRVANFEGKVTGSTVENPHIARRTSGGFNNKEGLLTPSEFTSNPQVSEIAASSIDKLDGSTTSSTTSSPGKQAQHPFSFNIIEEIERKVGKIPKDTLAEKVQWCKDNLARLTLSWWGFGIGPDGNKATLVIWAKGSSSWTSQLSHANSTVQKLTTAFAVTPQFSAVDNDGIIHFLAYADPSDGTTPSVINTDYVELEIELKPNADFHNPKVPLYEVTQDEYNKILTDWDANEVINRYPSVEGVQHVVNPVVSVSGGNLADGQPNINPERATINGLYEFTINTDFPGIEIEVTPNQPITFSWETDGASVLVRDANDTTIQQYTTLKSFVISNNTTNKIRIIFRGVGKSVKNWMLTLGTQPKPFTPKNDSHLYAGTTLAGIGNNRDTLFKQDGVWYKRKVWGTAKLDGNLEWNVSYGNDYEGFKRIYFIIPENILGDIGQLMKSDGTLLTMLAPASTNADHQPDAFKVYDSKNQYSPNRVYVYIPDTDSGWADDYTPTAQDIKDYFNANPYYLTYQLATPVIEPVTVEGDLSIQGMTQVEVGEGVVVREKVRPSVSGDFAYINRISYPLSQLAYRTKKILSLHKNGEEVVFGNPVNQGWVITSADANGNERLSTHVNNYDPTAEYTVTYTVLDKHQITSNLTDVKATYNQSLKSAFNDVVAKQSDLATDISINNRSIIDLYVRVKALEGI